MARINVETKLWQDVRFRALVTALGDEEKAIGAVIRVWATAQEYWIKDKSLIPEKIWKIAKFCETLIEVGLCEKREGGIYVCGSEERFAWLIAVRDNGKRGGRPKETVKLTPQDDNLGLTKTEPSSNLDEPRSNLLTLTPILALDKKTKDRSKQPSANAAGYKFDLEGAYKKYPRKEGKTPGFKICRREITTPELFEELILAINNYALLVLLEKREKTFVLQFGTFMGRWRDYLPSSQPVPVERTLPAEKEAERKKIKEKAIERSRYQQP